MAQDHRIRRLYAERYLIRLNPSVSLKTKESGIQHTTEGWVASGSEPSPHGRPR